MNSDNSIQSSIPDDIALKIVSNLQVADICSLGSCSSFWKDLCDADYLWEGLCRDRWPDIDEDGKTHNPSSPIDHKIDLNTKGWRELYKSKHKEMARRATLIIDFVERAIAYESIEVGNYLKAIELLESLQFEFKDIQMLLFKRKLNVQLNLVGLHYCIIHLGAPIECVAEALNRSHISGRKVSVQWWKLGRWFYGFRLRDEFHCRNVALGDLVVSNEVLSVLRRGAIHEVIRVQISAAKPAHSSWSEEVVQSLM